MVLRTNALVSLLLLLTISKLFIYTLNSAVRSQLQSQHEYKKTATKINILANTNK
jgi:phage-related holin